MVTGRVTRTAQPSDRARRRCVRRWSTIGAWPAARPGPPWRRRTPRAVRSTMPSWPRPQPPASGSSRSTPTARSPGATRPTGCTDGRAGGGCARSTTSCGGSPRPTRPACGRRTSCSSRSPSSSCATRCAPTRARHASSCCTRSGPASRWCTALPCARPPADAAVVRGAAARAARASWSTSATVRAPATTTSLPAYATQLDDDLTTTPVTRISAVRDDDDTVAEDAWPSDPPTVPAVGTEVDADVDPVGDTDGDGDLSSTLLASVTPPASRARCSRPPPTSSSSSTSRRGASSPWPASTPTPPTLLEQHRRATRRRARHHPARGAHRAPGRPGADARVEGDPRRRSAADDVSTTELRFALARRLALARAARLGVRRPTTTGRVREVVILVRDVHERIEAGLLLAERERAFREVFDSSPVGLAVLDDHGRFVAVNDAFCRLVGRTRENVRSTVYEALLHHEDRAAAVVARVAAYGGGRGGHGHRASAAALGRHGDLGAHPLVGDRVRPRAAHAALGRGRDLGEGGRGPAAPRRAARSADRPAQPAAHRRPHRARARPRAAHRHAPRAVLHRPRRPQARQRHASVAAPGRRRPHHAASPRRSAAACATPTRSAASAATSSSSSARTPGDDATVRDLGERILAAVRTPCRHRHRDGAGRREHRRRRARRARDRRAADRPRRQRDVPREGPRAALASCTPTPSTTATALDLADGAAVATRCGCTTARSSRSRPVRCSVSRPCSAASTPERGLAAGPPGGRGAGVRRRASSRWCSGGWPRRWPTSAPSRRSRAEHLSVWLSLPARTALAASTRRALEAAVLGVDGDASTAPTLVLGLHQRDVAALMRRHSLLRHLGELTSIGPDRRRRRRLHRRCGPPRHAAQPSTPRP